MTARYAPERYWEDLLAGDYSEAGVGYANLARGINRAMYASLLRAVSLALPPGTSPGRVLDVGSGTGIWIDYWRARGAREIVAMDLTETAVSHLRARFPDVVVEQADVSADALPVDGEFDTISAMSVLLHVTDDARYRRAVANLAERVAAGGTLVLIEPAVVHRWWGAPAGPAASSKARPLAELTSTLEAAGLEVERVRPATVLLANTGDTRTRFGWRAHAFYWTRLSMHVGRDERRGRRAARLLGPLDRALLRVVPSGPSAKVIVARRR